MASVLGSKTCEDHVIYSLKLNFEEAKELKGSINNIHLIPEELAEIRSTVFERGRKGCTKYLLIPKSLRKGFEAKKEVRCFRLENKDKAILAYIINKLG